MNRKIAQEIFANSPATKSPSYKTHVPRADTAFLSKVVSALHAQKTLFFLHSGGSPAEDVPGFQP